MKKTSHLARKKKRVPAGLPPGQLVYTGTNEDQDAELSIIEYGPSVYRESFKIDHRSHKINIADDTIIWINLNGLNNIELVDWLQKSIGLNRLAVEDALVMGQRAKFDEFKEHCSFISQVLHLSADCRDLQSEQVSIFWARNYVITFQEKEEDVLKVVRQRIKEGVGKIRTCGADYLAYAIIDAMFDHNLLLSASFEEHTDTIQSKLGKLAQGELEELFLLRKNLLRYKRITAPGIEALHRLLAPNSRFLMPDNREFFQDVLDHALATADYAQSLIEELTSYTELRLAILSQKSNETIHVLTIVSTIFIPLTFLSSIYGMNFDNMPELHHPSGYFILWIIMVALIVVQIVYFRRRHWI